MNQDSKAELPKIQEIIVVEGRDDTNAIKRAVDAMTIETHGFGISKATWELLNKAYDEKGLIIFTDPDHGGQQIRKRLKESYPLAKEAFLSRDKAYKDQDIGIENAAPEDIREALLKARPSVGVPKDGTDAGDAPFTLEDLYRYGLSGREDSRARRELAGDRLGIGYSNAKSFCNRLNGLGITREELERALEWT